MQTSTIVILACLLAVVYAQSHYEPETIDSVQAPSYEVPVHSNHRAKRGLLLLKKKLLLGALGLKVAKAGAVAGVAGAIALKSKPKSVDHTYYHHVQTGW